MIDEASYDRNNQSLKIEFKKKNSNNAIIIKLMELTFQERRNIIVTKPTPLVDMLVEYPVLSKKEWVRWLRSLILIAL
jgi:hypothetical protein